MESDKLRICFIGNSFTFYNDLPHMVQSLLLPSYPGGVEIGACLRGGKSFKTLWEEGADMERAKACIGDKDMYLTVKDMLAAPGGWDVVVLQDYSQGPARRRLRGESLRSLSGLYIPTLTAMAEQTCKSPVVLMFQSWGYRAPTKQSEEIGDFKVMTRKLAAGYFAYAALLEDAGFPTSIVPAGTAFEAVHDRNEDLWRTLYAPDHYHPSAKGSFLIACLVALTLARHPMLSRPQPPRIVPSWPSGIRPHGTTKADDPDAFKKGQGSESPLDVVPSDGELLVLLQTVGSLITQ